MATFRILVIRLGAMGDIVHSLPAVARLKENHPGSHLTWVVKPQWMPLLAGNPSIDEIIPFERTIHGITHVWQELRSQRYDLAVDLQGLMQSALIAQAARPRNIIGVHSSQARETLAAWFYSTAVLTKSQHRVDRYLELADAASANNSSDPDSRAVFSIPAGVPEGCLPDGKFVLTCPLAGWGSKQWPLAAYSELAHQLTTRWEIPLVVNGPPQSAGTLRRIEGAHVHLSGISGLIHATRRAHAVIGVDSGPLHLAAALGKRGVAIYGPTDPVTHGPYGGTVAVLRDGKAVNSYKRSPATDPSMLAISPEQVFQVLQQALLSTGVSPTGPHT